MRIEGIRVGTGDSAQYVHLVGAGRSYGPLGVCAKELTRVRTGGRPLPALACSSSIFFLEKQFSFTHSTIRRYLQAYQVFVYFLKYKYFWYKYLLSYCINTSVTWSISVKILGTCIIAVRKCPLSKPLKLRLSACADSTLN